MPNTGNGNSIFMMFMASMFVIGIIICIFAFKVSKNVASCSDKIQKAVRGLLVMGVIIATSSATFMVCGCNIKNSFDTGSAGMIFITMMCVLGVIVLGLTSVIRDCKQLQHSISGLFIISILMVVIPFLIFMYKIYSTRSKNINNKQDTLSQLLRQP
jgi:hypothetical protein